MSSPSTNPEPPPEWMLPSFDPNSAKVAELRSILLENNIPHSYTRKYQLVELFEKQVKPITAKLLKAHRNVKPSAEGIIDMSTGRQLQIDDYLVPPTTRTPRKKSFSVNLTDQESLTSTASRPRRQKKPAREIQDLEEVASQADAESTPESHQPSINRIPTGKRIAKSPASTSTTPHKLGKRKTGDKIVRTDEDSDEEELHNLARAIADNQSTDVAGLQKQVTRVTASMRASPKESSSQPIKRRKSDFPMHNSTAETIDDTEASLVKKKVSKPKNRRTTLHEVIEAGEANYSDLNPFQSAPEEDSTGGSGKKTKSAKRQSSVPRPSAVPASLPKSSTFSSIPSLNASSNNKLFQPHFDPLSSSTPFTPRQATSSLPKSVTTSNVRSFQTPVQASSGLSDGFPSLPSSRRLTMQHLQSDSGTPEQIYRQLVPGSRQSHLPQGNHDSNQLKPGLLQRPSELSTQAVPSVQSSRHGQVVGSKWPQSIVPQAIEPQPRRQSQLSQTPHQSNDPTHSTMSDQTPVQRVPIQRIRLDDLVHHEPNSEKRLKIRRKPPISATQHRGILFMSPSEILSFMLKLGILSLMLGALNWHSEQSRKLGYCDTGMNSNSITRDRTIDQFLDLDEENSDEGNNRFSTSFRIQVNQVIEASRSAGILPDCQSCPHHAQCERGIITGCEKDYVLKHGKWERIVNDWMPTLMGPKCVPDASRLIKIIEMAHEANQILRKTRGDVLCGMGIRATDHQEEDEDVNDELTKANVRLYGMKEEDLQEMILKKLKNREKVENTQGNEGELLDLALADLAKHEEIIIVDGWVSTRNFNCMDLGWQCRLKLGIYRLLNKLKLILLGGFTGLLGWIYLKVRLARLGEEKQKVKELVEITLTKLRDESWIHHTNPTLQPNPMIASAHLRDLILSYEHSPIARQSLWKKVEKVIEGNSNVRTKLSEQRGESIKVWEWIGSYSGEVNMNNSSPLNSNLANRNLK